MVVLVTSRFCKGIVVSWLLGEMKNEPFCSDTDRFPVDSGGDGLQTDNGLVLQSGSF